MKVGVDGGGHKWMVHRQDPCRWRLADDVVTSFCRKIHTSSRCHTITSYHLNCQTKKLNNEGKLYAALPQRASRHRRWGLRLRAFHQTPKTHYGSSCMGISYSRKGKLYDLPFPGTISCVDCKSCWCKEKYVRFKLFGFEFLVMGLGPCCLNVAWRRFDIFFLRDPLYMKFRVSAKS